MSDEGTGAKTAPGLMLSSDGRRILYHVCCQSHYGKDLIYGVKIVLLIIQEKKKITSFHYAYISVQFIATISRSLLRRRTQHQPILVLYIPNQSADREMKTKAGSPRVASYDMMMRLCRDLMTDTMRTGLSFLGQNSKCQRL